MKHLHTGQFKQVYKEVKTPLPHVNFLILGFLVWLEQHYLDYTIKANVDSAIKDYLKNDKNLRGQYTTCTVSHFPHWQQCYYRLFGLIESHELHESNCNKDVTILSPAVRLVKCGLPFTLIRNMDAVWDCYNVWPSVCVSVVAVSYRS